MTTPKRTMVCAAFLVVSTFAALRADESTVPQQSPRTANPNTRAITGVNVVVSPGRAISDCTIVIRNGRITAVGQDVAVPAEAVTIALDGHSVYAGFIDAYNEQSLSSDRLNGTARYWNGQVTPQLSAADQIPDAGESDKHRREGFVARLVAPADGVIRGTSAVVSTGNGRPGQLLLARDVAQNLLLTLQRRSRGNGFPGSPMGAVALARQAILDAQWYRDAGSRGCRSDTSSGGTERRTAGPATRAERQHARDGINIERTVCTASRTIRHGIRTVPGRGWQRPGISSSGRNRRPEASHDSASGISNTA